MHVNVKAGWSGLEVMVRIFQHWHSAHSKSKTPAVVQPMSLDDSAGLQRMLVPQRHRLWHQRRNGLASRSEGKQANGKSFFLPCPLYRLPWGCVVQIEGGFSHLKWFNNNHKNPHSYNQPFGFELIPYVVKLTTMSITITHHFFS